MPEEFKNIIIFALNTGMRLGEILVLKWEWIVPEESTKKTIDILAHFSNSVVDKITDKEGSQ